MELLNKALETVYSHASVPPLIFEEAFEYLNAFSPEDVQYRYFYFNAILSKIPSLQSHDIIYIKDTVIAYLKSPAFELNDDLSLIKKLSHLYFKLILHLYPNIWSTPFSQILSVINSTDPNSVISVKYTKFFIALLEVISFHVTEKSSSTESETERANIKMFKEYLSYMDFPQISDCLIYIISNYNLINDDILDNSISVTAELFSWINWIPFTNRDFISSVINIIKLEIKPSISALRLISIMSQRGMAPAQKLQYLFKTINVVDILERIFISSNEVNMDNDSFFKIQFVSARNTTLSGIVHQTLNVFSNFNQNMENEAFYVIKNAFGSYTRLIIKALFHSQITSIKFLTPAICDLLSFIHSAKLNSDKVFESFIITSFNHSLSLAAYPNWYTHDNSNPDESDFDECRSSLISVIRTSFALTPQIAINELAKNIHHLCSYRHRVLPCQSEIITLTCILAIDSTKFSNEVENAILPLFQTSQCRCCNIDSFVLNDFKSNALLNRNISDIIERISKLPRLSSLINSCFQYLIANINSNYIHTSTLRFLKNSLIDNNHTFDTSQLIASVKPLINIPFVRVESNVDNKIGSHLTMNRNEVYYEILSILFIYDKSKTNTNYFYEILKYLSVILNQIFQSQYDEVSLSYWFLRVLNAFLSLINPISLSKKPDHGKAYTKTILDFLTIAAPLIKSYSKYQYIRNTSLSICRVIVVLGKTDHGKEAVNCISSITKILYNNTLEHDEDNEFCIFSTYFLKSFPKDYFSKKHIIFIFEKHLKSAFPSMNLIKTSKESHLWKVQHDHLIHFLHFLLVLTTNHLEAISDNLKLNQYDWNLLIIQNRSIKQRLFDFTSKSRQIPLFIFLLICSSTWWTDFISTSICHLALQNISNLVSNPSLFGTNEVLAITFHVCSAWILDNNMKSGEYTKIYNEVYKILYALAPAALISNGIKNEHFNNIIASYNRIEFKEFANKLTDLRTHSDSPT